MSFPTGGTSRPTRIDSPDGDDWKELSLCHTSPNLEEKEEEDQFQTKRRERGDGDSKK